MQHSQFDQSHPHGVQAAPTPGQPVYSYQPAVMPVQPAQPDHPAKPDKPAKPAREKRRHGHWGLFRIYFLVCGILANLFVLGLLIVKLCSLLGTTIH